MCAKRRNLCAENLRAQNLQAPRKSKICGHQNLQVRKICRGSDFVSAHAKSADGKICPESGLGNIYGGSVLKLCVAFFDVSRGGDVVLLLCLITWTLQRTLAVDTTLF